MANEAMKGEPTQRENQYKVTQNKQLGTCMYEHQKG